MELLKRLLKYSKEKKDLLAFINAYTEETMSFSELESRSNAIAGQIIENLEDDHSPVIVYGHKSPDMISSFIACVKSGHPYCPVDVSMPRERLADIIDVSDAKLLIALEDIDVECEHKFSRENIKTIIRRNKVSFISENMWVNDRDVFYVIFTSGSTGRPKGVQITADCLDNYLIWMESLVKGACGNSNLTILNQAPFSFDLSVMDTYTSLFMGETIWAMDKQIQENMELMYTKLAGSKLNIWVSTPSFINVCLIYSDFNEKMLPDMKMFLFCGEVLTNKTARELHKRFPNSSVVNTYGPTESTVAVTEIVVSEEMASRERPLSVGYVKPGTEIYIMDDTYSYPGKQDGEKGEIVIAGNTVAKGYLNRDDLTKEKFFSLKKDDGKLWAYKTGDIGYLENGLLYYIGRMDFQLKLNGYRIELGDIESNILEMQDVMDCVVLPIEKKGEVKGLAAFVLIDHDVEDEFEFSQSIRYFLATKLPHYMIPKRCIIIDEMPMTNNGKIDRKALQAIL